MHDYEQINQARRQKQWKKLAHYAEKMLAEDAEDIYALQVLGEALEKQGLVDAATDCYERAWKLDKRRQHNVGHTTFLKRLDILSNRAGDYQQCLEVCEYYVHYHPDSWDAWNRLKRAAKNTGNSERSMQAKLRADAIKEERDEKERREKERYEEWKQIRDGKLRELGYDPQTLEDLIREAREGEPHPSLDASDEEWGLWLQRTTDLDKIEAEMEAGFYAAILLEDVDEDED